MVRIARSPIVFAGWPALGLLAGTRCSGPVSGTHRVWPPVAFLALAVTAVARVVRCSGPVGGTHNRLPSRSHVRAAEEAILLFPV